MNNKIPKIGIVGGIGPESTLYYYQHLINAFRPTYIKIGYPEMINATTYRTERRRNIETGDHLGILLLRMAAAGLHRVRSLPVLVWLVILAVASVTPASGQIGSMVPVREWLGFVEMGLGIGRMDHTVDGRQEELFGVDVLRKGGEQDVFGLRAGIGRELGGDILAVLYGGVAALTPGLFFDNHGPYIPPELTFSLTEISLGLEARREPFHVGAGCGFYSGTVTLHPDQREGFEPGDRWEGKLGGTAGPHAFAGLLAHADGCFGDVGLTLVWRYIPLQLPRTQTGATPEAFSKHMIELHLSVEFSGYIF